MAPAIEAAERNGGNWRAAVAESGVDADFYIFRDRSARRLLPWDIIDGGMKASFFQSEFDKGLREEWTLPPKRQKENLKLLPSCSSAVRGASSAHGADRRPPPSCSGVRLEISSRTRS